MAKPDPALGGYTTKQAAKELGVTEARIRQLVLGDDPIDSKLMLGRRIITPEGLKQARRRNTKIGRKLKSTQPAS